MHEMSILSNVMDVALKYAKENNAREVVSVTLVVGELAASRPWIAYRYNKR
ncbi:hydrogenase/urease maturation nickel metallochaperone HypA [Senegalimassilia faecalis]|uniref:Hydrogenase maturation nickel metallochaperone HypA n=1 Tax=Senegalimassilia faecalis TaxID=2509433 RepID=A0A4Q2JWM8_9ACTN|nr:hydrogenase/urease maturation nickel metallochaperone HypA [Senegalimassilia faecalis]RXZ53445.1 hydrogenase maturation nickel metallochaperone HypA [Senegalimassilia faecalis]